MEEERNLLMSEEEKQELILNIFFTVLVTHVSPFFLFLLP